MTEPSIPPAAPATVLVGGQPMAITDAMRSVRSSANWFWWVAGLSVINTVAAMLDSGYGMVLGLGVTQLIDAIFLYSSDGTALEVATGSRVAHLGLVAVFVGLFVLFGYFARAHHGWAFVVGMAAYVADAMVYVMASDWIGVGFHAFVLFMLWGGYRVLRALQAQAVPPATVV